MLLRQKNTDKWENNSYCVAGETAESSFQQHPENCGYVFQRSLGFTKRMDEINLQR